MLFRSRTRAGSSPQLTADCFELAGITEQLLHGGGGSTSGSHSRMHHTQNKGYSGHHGSDYTGGRGMNGRKRGLTDDHQDNDGSCSSEDREDSGRNGDGVMDGGDEPCTFISNNHNNHHNHHHNHHHSSRFTPMSMGAPLSSSSEPEPGLGSEPTGGESTGHSEMMRE